MVSVDDFKRRDHAGIAGKWKETQGIDRLHKRETAQQAKELKLLRFFVRYEPHHACGIDLQLPAADHAGLQGI